MAKITLDIPLYIEVQESGKTIKKIEVTYRYPTKEEEKEFNEYTQKMQQLFKKVKKLENKLSTLEKKIEYAEKREDYKKAEKLLDEKEKLEQEIEHLYEEFEANGGINFNESLSEMMFEKLVGGNGKESLREIAQRIGYAKIIEVLNKEREEYEKKHSSE